MKKQEKVWISHITIYKTAAATVYTTPQHTATQIHTGATPLHLT